MPTSGPVLGDNQRLEGWFRFVGAAVTRMPRTRVPAYRCGTDWSSWLDGAHPTVEDDEVRKRSVLIIVLPVVNTQQRFLLGIYIEIIAVFTLILRCIFSRDFTRSSFRHNNFNDLKLLGQIFYVDDVPINCAIKSASEEFHRSGYFHYFGRFCTLAALC